MIDQQYNKYENISEFYENLLKLCIIMLCYIANNSATYFK